MHPILFQIGPLTVYSYGVALAAAVLTCTWLLSRDAAKAGIARDATMDLMFWTVMGGIIGARVFYVLISWDYFSQNIAEILLINRGGLAWQGGFVGGLAGGLLFVRSRKLPFLQVLDLAAPYIALGQAIGRIGCFCNGCCYGKPWAHGLYFPTHHARLYPTQLYETIMLAAIFLALKYLRRPSWPRGTVFAFYLCLAGMERFIVEFYRADHDILFWGLSLSQFIAAGVCAGGIVLFLRLKQ